MHVKLFIQVAVLVLGGAFAWTQVVAPLWTGRRLFPWFRSRTTKIRRRIAQADDDLQALDLERELDDKRQAAQVKVEEMWQRAIKPLPHDEKTPEEDDRR